MSPIICYYEVGFETKHVKLAVKIPDLRSSKIQLKKKMKKPKMMIRNKRRKVQSYVDTSSLASINIDWKQEFEEKYAELIDKTQKRKGSKKEAIKEKFQEEMKNISLIANTSLLIETSDINLSISEQDSEENCTISESNENQNLLTSKKMPSSRQLKYSYHVLKTVF